jgi:hypothetical protein
MILRLKAGLMNSLPVLIYWLFQKFETIFATEQSSGLLSFCSLHTVLFGSLRTNSALFKVRVKVLSERGLGLGRSLSSFDAAKISVLRP